MTISGSLAPGASMSCTLPQQPPGTTGAAGAPADAAGGGGATAGGVGATAELTAAIEQLRVAVEQLAQVVGQLSVSGGGGNGASGSGCGMAGCGGATSGAAMIGASGAPSSDMIGVPAPAGSIPEQGPSPSQPQSPPPVAGTPATQAPRLAPSDAELAKRIDDKVLKGTGMAGQGAVIVEAARKYRIPIDFALSIYQKEANFAKSGTLADRNNNPGNLRFADWQTEHGGVKNGGFTKYPTMQDGIRASMHLLSMGRYKDAVARRDWGAVISIYAPSSENDTAGYIRQMNGFTANFRNKLGIDEHWVER